MKKLICTGKFEGEFFVVYNEEHQLVMFDFRDAVLTPKMVHYFTQNVPVLADVDHFKAIFKTLTIIDEDYAVSFDMFWNRYDKKINLKRCQPLWEKLSKADQVRAYTGLNRYLRACKPISWREKG
jgi:hypothetical protein